MLITNHRKRWKFLENSQKFLNLVSLWPGKDYVNTNRSNCKNPELPFNVSDDVITRTFHVIWNFQENMDRANVPRMPWHDCHLRVEGAAARALAYNFIQVIIISDITKIDIL